MGLHKQRLKLNQGWAVPERLPPSLNGQSRTYRSRWGMLYRESSHSLICEYQREILDVADSRKCNYLSIMAAAQSGKTTCCLSLAAYYILQKPRSIIFLLPSEADVRIFQAGKFDPLIRANPELWREHLSSHDPRREKTTRQVKDFRGGHLMFSLVWLYRNAEGTLRAGLRK